MEPVPQVQIALFLRNFSLKPFADALHTKGDRFMIEYLPHDEGKHPRDRLIPSELRLEQRGSIFLAAFERFSRNEEFTCEVANVVLITWLALTRSISDLQARKTKFAYSLDQESASPCSLEGELL
jgi:hypothetical protein